MLKPSDFIFVIWGENLAVLSARVQQFPNRISQFRSLCMRVNFFGSRKLAMISKRRWPLSKYGHKNSKGMTDIQIVPGPKIMH